MRLAETVTFGGSGLDRAAHLRADAAPLRQDPRATVLPVWRGKPLVDPDSHAAAWVPVGHPALPEGAETVFLGLDDGAPRFATDLSAWTPDGVPDALDGVHDPSEQRHPDLPGAVFIELRRAMPRLTARAAELLAMARALVGWHATHRFCARCGAESVAAMAGWQRDCPACGGRHFPRTDPVVIMLITHGNDVLLGRNAGWPAGMHSLLAGFVEPGETIEAAVRREVREEAGVTVGRVGYLASQPWPFPSSLMLGCRGEATARDITVDPAELEAARWMSREAMVDVLCGRDPAVLPAREGAIARFLLIHWLADRLD